MAVPSDRKKVFVSGCYDLFHSGHAVFLKRAAAYGEVTVSIARDATVLALKGRAPANTEAERLFMVRSCKYVKDAFLTTGVGMMDFADDLRRCRPDIFIVNTDGDSTDKRGLCEELHIEYIVLPRTPEPGLPPRSTTALLCGGHLALPYRVEICGAWLDQPIVSKLCPGWVITASIEAAEGYTERSGLATSTRKRLYELYRNHIDVPSPELLARLLFRYENGIDTGNASVSGAQDAIGLCIPAVTMHYYEGGWWPARIEQICDEEKLRFIEENLRLFFTGERPVGCDPAAQPQLSVSAAAALSRASAACREAIYAEDAAALAQSLNACRAAQRALFPAMFPPKYEDILPPETAWKFTGAGGGGYLVTAGQQPAGAIPFRIRRQEASSKVEEPRSPFI
ncbi:MAG: adenylyltransferase/cytidyltransferase family protein [Oscillospiraceae bacterium]|jgi:cytidyltransferase-like protein|nr:adenylyltransferase/cytidyltransferase family protein [Oscillospiraceae bacterium]